MFVYRRSVSNCVSFPWFVYFCLFSPLKDRYAFSICLQLLGALPQTPTGALLLDPAGGGFRPRPRFAPPLANFWLRSWSCARLVFAQPIHRWNLRIWHYLFVVEPCLCATKKLWNDESVSRFVDLAGGIVVSLYILCMCSKNSKIFV